MKANVRFMICKHCGNIVGFIKDKGTPLTCCGEPMKELKANTTDGATEKHVPDVKFENGKLKVQVGSTLHPMLPEHYIEWIAVVTENGTQRVSLAPGEEPVAEFCIDVPAGAEVFEYCNLHGLWKVTL